MRRARPPVAASIAAALVATVLAAGCGDDAGQASSALVDSELKAPPINTLEFGAGGDELLLTTNRGFYRIADGEATPQEAAVSTPDGRSPVGTFLVIETADGEVLLGSGHPDEKRKVAPFMGLIRSEDGGESWRSVSRYGIADLHVIRPAHGMLYAYDAVIPALLISSDDGRTWEEKTSPPGLAIDFVVDPDDPDQLLASTDKEIFHSTDRGETWSETTSASKARLDWPEPDALYRADDDGLVYLSSDAGGTWEPVGHIDGEPWKLVSGPDGALYAALADATIVRSSDEGSSWEEYFTP